MGKTAVIGWVQPPHRVVIVQRPDASATKSVPSWCSLSHARAGLTDVQTGQDCASLITEVPLNHLLAILRAVEMHSVGRLVIRADGTLLILARSPSSLAEASTQLWEGQPGVHSHRLQVRLMRERLQARSLSQTPTLEPSPAETSQAELSSLLREPVIPQPAIAVAISGLNELRQLLGRLGRQGLVRLAIKQPQHRPTEGLVDLCWTVDKLLMSVTVTSLQVRPLSVGDTVCEGEDVVVSVGMEQLQRALFHASLLQATTTVLAVIPDHVLVISVSIGSRDPLVFDEQGSDERSNRITYFVPAAAA